MTITQQISYIIGGLGLFLFGMKVMSEALQLVAGDRMRSILRKMTGNRIAGMFTGVTITAVIQSSSATTVMVVSLVSAGLITLHQSIGVILGANIGTTVTAWLVALFGFKIKIASFALPAIGLGFLIRFVGKGRNSNWGEVVLGFGLLFLGLFYLKQAVPDATASPEFHDWLATYSASSLPGTLLVLLIGSLVTAIIQSSSATTAIVLVMVSQGLVDMKTAMVLFMGANIGTTVTALLASIGTNVNARRAALAHFLFNVLGSLWVLLLLNPIVGVIDAYWPQTPGSDPSGRLFPLTIFHTIFNLANTAIFLPFVNPFAALVQKMIPSDDTEEELAPRLRFADIKILDTPSLLMPGIRLEIQRMVRLVREMFELAMTLTDDQNEKSDALSNKIKNREHVVDLLEREITDLLAQVSRSKISRTMAREIAGLITATSDLERIGDHCEALLKLLLRKREAKLSFTEDAYAEIDRIAADVQAFLLLIEQHMAPKTNTNIMSKAEIVEDSINQQRWKMRRGHISRLNDGSCDVPAGLVFLDMVTSFEKIGDHAFNVAEVISGAR